MSKLKRTKLGRENFEFIFSVVIAIALGATLWGAGVFSDSYEDKNAGTDDSAEAEIPLVRTDTYSITSSDPPFITEATFDPLNVIAGETQTVSVRINNETSIEFVSVTMVMNELKETHELELIEGNASDGVWAGSWTVPDKPFNRHYQAEIFTKSLGDESKVVISFR